ncbi:putative nuclease HARBI1 [Copidosoma floridanum]|uniref:putative nuclease HARBI1 n=1 Tax=Copidosoma floridanum TaxID=29053 RepID=UPI000C6FB073|nr:putative nuclease HARBI1 [Copidosoma floridanum]
MYLIYRALLNIETYQVNQVWVSELFKEMNKVAQGASDNLVLTLRLHDSQGFINFFRMSPEAFDELLSLVGPKITKKFCVRAPISATIRFQLTLRYLATGDYINSLSLLFRVSPTSVSKIIKETCKEIWNCLIPIVFISNPTQNDWRKISKGFESEWNFSHCLGCVDSKLIAMEAPPHSSSYFYDYKGHHSIHLQAYVDAYKKFIAVEVGAAGRQSDRGVFCNSTTGKMIINKKFNIPQPEPVVQDGSKLPYVFLGDKAFGLSDYMLTPYPRSLKLDLRKKVFNYRQSRARRIVECPFGELISTWRLFRKRVEITLPATIEAIKACVCLQNFLIMYNEEEKDIDESVIVDKNTQLQSVGNISARAKRNAAVKVRDDFAEYFMNEGAVPFQWEKC